MNTRKNERVAVKNFINRFFAEPRFQRMVTSKGWEVLPARKSVCYTHPDTKKKYYYFT